MVIGIIGAMDKEIIEIKNMIEDKIIIERANLKFIKGKLFNYNVVLVKSGIGKVNAALCTQILIDSFNVDIVVNTGIAGGVKKFLNPGDVVISEDLVYHDVDSTAFGDKLGQVPNMDIYNFKGDPDLVKLAFDSSKNIKGIKTYIGRIATGDQFIADSKRIDFIESFFNALAIEMEGAAVAHVCTLNGIKFVVIRSVSDRADGNAHMDYEEFQRIAIKNSTEILKNMIKSMQVI